MSKEDSWASKVGDNAYSRRQCEEALKAAKNLSMLRIHASPHIQPRHMDALVAEFEDINGGTLSGGGKMAALEILTPEMIGRSEAEWLKKISRHYMRMFNSVMDRELDDRTTFSHKELDKLSGDKKTLVIHLLTNLTQMDKVFHPIAPSTGR